MRYLDLPLAILVVVSAVAAGQVALYFLLRLI